jgi:hypothetical protein
VQLKETQQSENGVGVVWLNDRSFWALWVYEYTLERFEVAPGDWRERPHRDQRWKIRLSIDDFENLGVHEYERVRVKLARHDETSAYFQRRRTNPPFIWLELGKDVRR